MARGLVSIKNTGLTEIADYLDKLADKYDQAILQSFDVMQDVVVERIRTNWVTLAGGKAGGFVYDSIGKSNAMSKTDEHTVVGTMGVYHMDAVAAAHGKTPKDFNAPQIAYWVEYGTSRLKVGGRKEKGKEYGDDELTIGIAAKSFIGNAFYASIDAQNEAFKVKFNSILDKIT
jgi:hypothetical protein